MVPPRHCDAGGHHLCFVVDDVDEAVVSLRTVDGVTILGGTKEVASGRMQGSKWT
jgi:hypothetical protein